MSAFYRLESALRRRHCKISTSLHERSALSGYGFGLVDDDGEDSSDDDDDEEYYNDRDARVDDDNDDDEYGVGYPDSDDPYKNLPEDWEDRWLGSYNWPLLAQNVGSSKQSCCNTFSMTADLRA